MAKTKDQVALDKPVSEEYGITYDRIQTNKTIEAEPNCEHNWKLIFTGKGSTWSSKTFQCQICHFDRREVEGNENIG